MLHPQQQYLFLIILAAFINLPCQLMCNTLVYNLRIRRAFAPGHNWQNNPLLKEIKIPHWIATALPITYHRTRDIITAIPAVNVHESSNVNGAALNLRFKPNKHWWLEATTGIEKETAHFSGTSNFCVQRTGFDDIVLTSGVNFYPSDDAQLVAFGLMGFPTKTSVSALEVFDTPVGTRFYSLGIGGEASYAFINTFEQALIGIFQTRFIHFFNRTWAPILPITSQIQPGNITDLLFTIQYRNMFDIFEIGYNPTFFTDQAVVAPTSITKTNTFVRHSFYTTYNHIILEPPHIHTPLILGLGANFGWSTMFNTKICAAWISITALF